MTQQREKHEQYELKKKTAKYYRTDIKISCFKRKEIKVFINIVATMMDDKHGPKHFCFVRWKLKC